MRTFAEKNNAKPFDWNAFLNQPTITEEEWENQKDLALDWVTCACGNQCSVIPRNERGQPYDKDLTNLGGRFYDEIKVRNIDGAKETLELIEERSAVLIKEIADELALCQ